MWFDAKAKLAEFVGDTHATSATSATQNLQLSQLSRVSQAPSVEAQKFFAKVESFIAPSQLSTEADCGSFGGRATTWTGRVVSPEGWWHLSAWDQKGPDGRVWCGLSHSWR